MSFELDSYTITHQLKWRANHLSNKLALCYLADGETESERLTYSQLHHAAIKIAARLQSFNLKNKTVLLLYSSGIAFVKAFFGCLYAGVIAVPMYVPKSQQILKKIENIQEDCDAQMILTTQDLVDQGYLKNSKLAELPLLDTETIARQDQIEIYQEISTHPEDTVFIQYTSGSTSQPKGAMVSHTNIMVNQVMLQHVFELNENSVGVTWLPLFHDMGLIASLLNAIFVGYPIYIMPPAAFIRNPLRWLQCISKYRGTYTCAPNFAYDLCIKNIPRESRDHLDLSSLKKAINASEPVQPATLQKFTKEFSPYGFREQAFTPAYGLAEATVFVTGKSDSVIKYVYLENEALKNNKVVYSESEKDTTKIVSCGIANILGQKIKIINPNTLEEVFNEIGEICISGEHIVKGYINKPVINQETFGLKITDRTYLRTGDLGFIDRGGHLYITGRIKDLIIISGHNYYPQDIEITAESKMPLVRKNSIAAFSIERNHTEKLIIVIELNRKMLEGFEPTKLASEINAAVFQENALSAHQIIFIAPGTLPKTTSGKIERQTCKKMYLANQLQVTAKWDSPYRPALETNSNELLNCIKQFMAKTLKIDSHIIKDDSRFADFKLDSIQLAGLSVELEKMTKRVLPEKIFYESLTIQNLINSIEQLGAPTTKTNDSIYPSQQGESSRNIVIPKFKPKFASTNRNEKA